MLRVTEAFQGSGTPSTREYALDATRAVLLMMGLVLHTANIYAVNANWLVQDAQVNPFFNWLTAFIHLFRMPAFFWLSGYFCALAITKAGYGRTMANRALRLGVPLAFTWLLINSVQVSVLGGPEGGKASWFSNIPPQFHLWFLVDLIVITPAAGLILVAMKRLPGFIKATEGLRWLPLLLAATVIAQLLSMLLRMTGVAYAEILGLTTLFRLANSLPYFALGFLMFHSRPLRNSFESVPTWLVISLGVMGTFAVTLLPRTVGLASEVQGTLNYFVALVLTSGALKLANSVAYEKHHFVQMVAGASYTIYLFHHVLVVLMGTLLLDWHAPVMVKFLVVFTIVFVATVVLHYKLIARVRWLRFAFNGSLK